MRYASRAALGDGAATTTRATTTRHSERVRNLVDPFTMWPPRSRTHEALHCAVALITYQLLNRASMAHADGCRRGSAGNRTRTAPSPMRLAARGRLGRRRCGLGATVDGDDHAIVGRI